MMELGEIAVVCSNDFSRYRVTKAYAFVTPISGPLSSSQSGSRPGDCSCYGISHNRRATTEVVTTNFLPNPPISTNLPRKLVL
ncbi:MAG: hypothetical protein ACRC8Y_25125 [Chroococcales cyanobacterium]